MAKIILRGKPISVNSLYNTICRNNFPTRYMTQKGKDLKTSYQWQVNSQYRGKIKKNSIGVNIDLYFSDNRANDIDNFSKLLLDSLTGIVFEDDRQINKLILTKNFNKENPRVEIEIYDL